MSASDTKNEAWDADDAWADARARTREEVRAAFAPRTRVCRNCGHEEATAARACPRCGTPYVEMVDPGMSRRAKQRLALARWIVARSHGDEAARAAEEHFDRVVRHHEAPDEVPEHALPAGDPVHLPALLADAFELSTSEARRLIGQGGVKLDGESVSELDLPRNRLAGAVLQAGKRRFVRLNEAT